MLKFLGIVFASLILTCFGGGRVWDLSSLPSLKLGTWSCISGNANNLDRICNPDNILRNPALVGKIQSEMVEIENTISHKCGSKSVTGYEIVTVIVGTIEAEYDNDKAYAAQTMAKAIHDAWGVGHEACNDGIVVFLSVYDRQIYISTGEGVKKLITGDHIEAIIHRMKPAMRSKNYEEGVLGTIMDIRSILEAGPKGVSTVTQTMKELAYERRYAWIGRMLPWLFFLVVGGFIAWMSYSQQQRQRANLRSWEEARDRLTRIERARAEAEAEARANRGSGSSSGSNVPFTSRVSMCPICLDDFPTSSNSAPVLNPATGQPAEVVVLPCRHKFHLHCVDSWVGGNGRNSCPVCRRSVYDDGNNNDAPRAGDRPPSDSSNPTMRQRPNAGSSSTSSSSNDSDSPSCAPNERPYVPPARPQEQQQQQRNGFWDYLFPGLVGFGIGRFFGNNNRFMPPGYQYMPGMPGMGVGVGVGMNGFNGPNFYANPGGMYPNDYTGEMMFLLNAMQRRYNNVITPDMLRGWTADPNGLRTRTFTADTMFTNAHPTVQARLQMEQMQAMHQQATANFPGFGNMGHIPSAGRLGGGNSRRGGGGGGSW
jgi:uncharacterized membrane protein YgcG